MWSLAAIESISRFSLHSARLARLAYSGLSFQLSVFNLRRVCGSDENMHIVSMTYISNDPHAV